VFFIWSEKKSYEKSTSVLATSKDWACHGTVNSLLIKGQQDLEAKSNTAKSLGVSFIE
jgi:hypothetical protein